MTQTYESPPGRGGDFEKRFDGQSKTFSEDSSKRTEKQRPRHIGEIAAKILIAGAEQRIDRLQHRLPRLYGGALIDAKSETQALTQFVDDLEHGRPIDLPGGRAAA